MFKPVTIQYTWDKETFLKASHVAYKYEMKHSPKRFLGWLFIVMTQFSVVAAMKKEAVGLLLISTILTIYWYFLRWPMRRAMLRKSFDSIGNANHTFKIIASEEGLMIDEQMTPWDKVLEVVSLEEGYLLYYSNTFVFFPVYAFKDLEEKNRFSTLAKEKVKYYKKG
jgi:hypothetical protein